MSGFVVRRQAAEWPRLPLKGSLDLTYRCNNDCRHCWLRLGPDAVEKDAELSFDEIRRVVEEARAMGCRRWTISGGEPMIRPDFAEIFDFITRHAASYTLVTNGTLVSPAIARLLKRPGTKLVALYGATASTHDGVTRRPGSFEALSAGVAYLREEGTGFSVQIVPLKDNHHEFEAMVRLAESWSPSWRLGASWLYLSASGDPAKNAEIRAERLGPAEIVAVDPPAVGAEDGIFEDGRGAPCARTPSTGSPGPYTECLARRRDFHIDPYGGMSFCCYVKDPSLRRDLRRESFREIWDVRLPAMAAAPLRSEMDSPCAPGPAKAAADGTKASPCGACDLRADCRWCPAFAYLERRDHGARIEYLCGVAREARRFREDWARAHRRFYAVGGLTVEVDADLPFADETFHPKFELFRSSGPSGPVIRIHHHFSLPDLEGEDLGREVYRRPPWAVYRKGSAWIYLGVYPQPGDSRIHRVLVFNDDHTRGHIYNPTTELFRFGRIDSLMLLSSDQIVLARALPSLGGAFIHAAGLVLGGRGLLFAGASEAGKSTVTSMLAAEAKILCDDRMIIRRAESGGFSIHGTWSHGTVPVVAPDAAPLHALFFLRQARENRIERIEDPKAIFLDLLPRFVRPLVTADWWDKVLGFAGDMAASVPFYNLYFDKSGRVVPLIRELAG